MPVATGAYSKARTAGNNWIVPNGNITLFTVESIADRPSHAFDPLRGHGGGGVYKSTDSGATWSRINNGLQSVKMNKQDYHRPGNPSVLYLGYSDGDAYSRVRTAAANGKKC